MNSMSNRSPHMEIDKTSTSTHDCFYFLKIARIQSFYSPTLMMRLLGLGFMKKHHPPAWLQQGHCRWYSAHAAGQISIL